MKQFGTWFFFLSSLVLTGCGVTHVVVEGDYPEPLAKQLPYDIGLFYPPEFLQYDYEDDASFGVKVSLGHSQRQLFSEILAGMFRSTTELASLTDAQGRNVQLVVVPHVEEVQLTLPRDTQMEIYELWIKYNIQVFDAEGEPIADWIMTSYGKTMDQFMSSKSGAINQAAIVALRDAGAQLVTKFSRAPGVREWLSSQQLSAEAGEPE